MVEERSAGTLEACPRCRAPRGAEAEECAACGVIFAKLAAMAERERRMAAALLEGAREEERPAVRPGERLHPRWWALLAVFAWTGLLALYYAAAARRPQTPRGPETSGQGTALLVDPDTGRAIRVGIAPARRRTAPPPPPPEEAPGPSDEFEAEAEAGR